MRAAWATRRGFTARASSSALICDICSAHLCAHTGGILAWRIRHHRDICRISRRRGLISSQSSGTSKNRAAAKIARASGVILASGNINAASPQKQMFSIAHISILKENKINGASRAYCKAAQPASARGGGHPREHTRRRHLASKKRGTRALTRHGAASRIFYQMFITHQSRRLWHAEIIGAAPSRRGINKMKNQKRRILSIFCAARRGRRGRWRHKIAHIIWRKGTQQNKTRKKKKKTQTRISAQARQASHSLAHVAANQTRAQIRLSARRAALAIDKRVKRENAKMKAASRAASCFAASR